jgi:serine/threonine protein kinase/CheY-like chemotaxis protein
MALILIADDSLVVRKSYESILSYLGHKVISCRDGKEAIDAFVKYSPDLLILDVDMPEMNGLDACREIRRYPKGISVPIIIVSALDEEEEILNGLNVGANDYLVKPIKEAHLIAKLKTSLGISSLHKKDFELVRSKTLFAGRYQVESLLGYGSHSSVFMVKDQQSDNRLCALKLLKESFDSRELILNFTSEARKLMTVDSPFIIKIYDLGTLGERIYLVMEYANGGDLLSFLKRRRMNELEGVSLGYDIIRGIKALRDKDVIHLDIKPGNILINDGQYKLADFGMIVPRSSGTIPMNQEIWSTAAYISPEYLTMEASLSSKSDIYSLGITIYQAITGDNPFESDRPSVGMFRQVNLNPPSLHDFDKNISTYFSDTVAAMLEKHPDNRPTEEELEDVLKNLIDYNKSREIQHQVTRAKRSGDELKANSGILLEEDEENKLTPLSDIISTEYAVETIAQRIEKLEIFKNQAKRKQHGDKLDQPTTWERISNPSTHDLKVACFGLGALALSIILGILCHILIFDDRLDDAVLGGPMLMTICTKCKAERDLRTYNPAKEKCHQCGAGIAVTMKCYQCNKVFPRQKIPDKGNMSDIDYNKLLGKPEKCPFCGSKEVEPKQLFNKT